MGHPSAIRSGRCCSRLSLVRFPQMILSAKPRPFAKMKPAEIVEVAGFGPPLPAGSASPVFMTEPVVGAPPVVVEYIFNAALALVIEFGGILPLRRVPVYFVIPTDGAMSSASVFHPQQLSSQWPRLLLLLWCCPRRTERCPFSWQMC